MQAPMKYKCRIWQLADCWRGRQPPLSCVGEHPAVWQAFTFEREWPVQDLRREGMMTISTELKNNLCASKHKRA